MAGKTIKGLSSVYLVAGNDEYSKELKVKELVSKTTVKESKELNFEVIDCEENETFDFDSKIKTVPFLAKKRTVILKNLEKLDDKMKDKLAEYLLDPSDLTCLILVTTEEKNRKEFEKNKFLQAVSKAAATFAYYQLYDNQVRAAVMERVRKFNKNISEDAVDILIERVGNNLRDLDSEINKIALYVGNKKAIEADDIQYLTSGLDTKDIYDLINAVEEKNLVKAVKILCGIFYYDSKLAPVLVGSIYQHFKRIWSIKALLKEGKSQDEVGRKFQIHPFFLNNYIRQANKFSEKQLKAIFNELSKADNYIKTGKIKYPQIVVEKLILNIIK